jgi:hypothetical protein
MTSNRLRNSLTAVLAFTVAATLIAGSAFAADGDGGKNKRRGNIGQLKTGTFQIVVPKADRDGSGRQVAKFVAPKADRTTAQFVAPKADRGKTGGPTTLFSVSPKAPRTNRGEVRGAKGPAWRWTDRCHGRAAEACRPATACAPIRPYARQGRAGHFCSGSG